MSSYGTYNYCCFCSGPLENARIAWLGELIGCLADKDKWPPGDGEWINPPGFPVPTKPIEEIMTLSVEEGKTWEDWVVVSPVFAETYVSPAASVSYGDVYIDGDDDWNTDGKPYLHIHRICLSFLCRRNSITPKDLWMSSFGPEASYKKYAHNYDGLFYCVEYYDMTKRNHEDFGYSIEVWDPRSTPGGGRLTWWDPESMEDTKWLLARPTELPKPEPLALTTTRPSSVIRRKVFDVSELFELILEYVVNLPEDMIARQLHAKEIGTAEEDTKGDEAKENDNVRDECYAEGGGVGQKKASNEGEVAGTEETKDDEEDKEDDEEDKEDDEDDDIREVPSAWKALETLVSLMQVDRWFYHSVRDRQFLFLQIMRNFGWMLPTTPADYAHSVWPEELTIEGPLSWHAQLDWRAYMMKFLRKENPHIRNRWRFHTMAVQFARGTDEYRDTNHPHWFWRAGKLGVKTSLVKPEPFGWEIPAPEDEDAVEHLVEKQFRRLTNKSRG